MSQKTSLTAAQRKALYDVFARYRAYKVAVATRTAPSQRGFASAIHPDLIHGTSFEASAPMGVSGIAIAPDFNPVAFKRFTMRIDYHVRQLHPYRRAIVRNRFLCSGKLPTDAELYGKLRQQGWYVSKRHYRTEKENALFDLFKTLNSKSSAENTTKK